VKKIKEGSTGRVGPHPDAAERGRQRWTIAKTLAKYILTIK